MQYNGTYTFIRGVTMKQLTIRGVDDQLHGALSQAAARAGLSVNRYVLRLLGERLGILQEKGDQVVSYDDLNHLAGTWTKEQGEAFLREVAPHRDIDASLWK